MSWWQRASGSFYPYRGYFWRYRGHYLAGVVALLLTNALQLSIPQLIKHVIESLQAGVPYGSLIAAILCVSILLFGTRVASRVFILNTSRRVEFDLLDVVYQKLQRLPLSFYLRRHTGDLMSRASNDVRLIRSLSGFGVLSLGNLIFFVALAVVFMGAIDVVLTLVAVLPFALLLLAVRVLSARLRHATIRTQEALSRLSSLIQETLSGIGVVQAYRMERVSDERFARENESYMAAALDQTRARALLMPFMSFAGSAAILLVLAVGGARVVAGSMSFGEFVAFHAYMGMLIGPTVMMGWTLSLFQRGLASFDRLTELLEAPETLSDPPASVPDAASVELQGGVEARELGFRYATAPGTVERRAALRDVSFRLAPGQHLGVVGPVGSGKTTLLRCAVRQLEVEPGRLYYDGRDATALPVATVRRAIGFVPQDDFLFSATIAENIAFGRRDASQAEIERAAHLAGIHDEVLRFPQGYGTLVGERGVTLSGGQRQRIALARALLVRPRILVLDDALSKVDADTASRILAALRSAAHGVTAILASHRIAQVQAADEILVLRDGAVEARGTHGALLESSDYYRDMAWRQKLESEVEALS